MSKRKKIIIPAIVVAALLGIAYYMHASFNGSVIHRAVMARKARAYTEKNYAGREWDVSFGRYDFKIGKYFCDVQSPDSPDTRFTVYETDKDQLADDYESRVTQKENTIWRLSDELDTQVEKILKDSYPYRTELVLGEFVEEKSEEDRAKLTPDMPLDIKNLPFSGRVTVWVETQNENPTWEEVAERLRELEKLFRGEVPDISLFSLSLQSKYVNEGGEWVPGDRTKSISVFDVPRDVITGDGLKEYLQQIKARQEAEQAAIENGEDPVKTEAAQ